jgi:hypothetical protein
MSLHTVPVIVEIKMVVYVLENWKDDLAHHVEFHFNESSHCASNELTALVRRLEERGDECACNHMEISFVRVATPEDVELFHADQDPT